MKRNVAYSILLVILFGLGFFAITTNNRFKNQAQTTDYKNNLSENEVIQTIFKEEFPLSKTPE